jgi:hypothetical protein
MTRQLLPIGDIDDQGTAGIRPEIQSDNVFAQSILLSSSIYPVK